MINCLLEFRDSDLELSSRRSLFLWARVVVSGRPSCGYVRDAAAERARRFYSAAAAAAALPRLVALLSHGVLRLSPLAEDTDPGVALREHRLADRGQNYRLRRVHEPRLG